MMTFTGHKPVAWSLFLLLVPTHREQRHPHSDFQHSIPLFTPTCLCPHTHVYNNNAKHRKHGWCIPLSNVGPTTDLPCLPLFLNAHTQKARLAWPPQWRGSYYWPSIFISVSVCPHAESTVGVSPPVAWVLLLTFRVYLCFFMPTRRKHGWCVPLSGVGSTADLPHCKPTLARDRHRPCSRSAVHWAYTGGCKWFVWGAVHWAYTKDWTVLRAFNVACTQAGWVNLALSLLTGFVRFRKLALSLHTAHIALLWGALHWACAGDLGVCMLINYNIYTDTKGTNKNVLQRSCIQTYCMHMQ